MIFVVRCLECGHLVGANPPVKRGEKGLCSHCNKEIDLSAGYFKKEPPVASEPEFDLLSVE